MKVFTTRESLKKFIQPYREKNLSLGFVPTMGALHEGHLSLIAASLKENAYTIVSIFVNPTQFDNPADLEKYPRTLEKDVQLLQKLSSDIVIFAPAASDFYQGKIVAKTFDFGTIANQMEGRFRKGHFDGVGTVVSLLFETVQPTTAYFGEKDFQQLQIIRKLVKILKLPVKIIGCPIAREPHGLARSSRNELLSYSDRKEAAFIYKTLQKAKKLFGIKSANEVRDWVKDEFKKNVKLSLEYFEIAQEDSLLPVIRKNKNKSYRAFIAVQCGAVRLIDNIALKH
ncbi:pantoate--beta-alanine ligase [Gangjinia marincola]|uniref:Pantothenate synthetase n=1 Tax=Gangjinia marincola TaxID=578463 RepID=A0ABP3XTP4_9FLAO